MALSQAQKNFFNVITSDSEKAWHDMQSGLINLASYKEQFLKDGTGLLHLVVYGVLYKQPFFREMYEYILSHSNLNIHDRANSKRDSAYEVFTRRYPNTATLDGQYASNDNEQALAMFCENLCYFLKYNKNDNTSFNKGLSLLLKYGHKNLYDELYQSRGEKHQPNSDIVRYLTKTDDLPRLQQLFTDYPDFIKKVATFNAYQIEARRHGEISNFLIYAIDKKAFKIANYYMDNSLMPMDGKIVPANQYHNPYTQHSRYGHRSTYSQGAFAKHTFFQALDTGNLEILTKVLDTLNPEERKGFFNSLSSDDSKKSNFVYMLTHQDDYIQNFAWQFLPDYFKSLKGDTKSQYIFIQNLISHHQPLDKTLKALNLVLPYYEQHDKVEWGHYNNYFFDYAFKNFKEDKSQLLIFGKIMKLMADNHLFRFLPDTLFNETFFTNKEVFDTVMQSGFDVNKHPDNKNEPFNLLSYYLKTFHSGIYQFKRDFDAEMVKADESSILKTIYQHMGDNLLSLQTDNSKMSRNVLEIALMQENFLVLDLLNHQDLINLALKPSILHQDMSDMVIQPEDIKKLTSEHQMTISGCLRFIKPETLEDKEKRNMYCAFIKKMVDIDYDFFQSTLAKEGALDLQNYPWLHLLTQHVDESLLLDIMNKHGKNMHDLSQSTKFWDAPSFDKTFSFIKKNGADYDNIMGLITCSNRNAQDFDSYLKHGGSLQFQGDNGNNIVHHLVQNRSFENATVVLNYMPELACEVNDQKKFPVSYAIVYFSKQCADFSTENNLSRREKIKQDMDIIKEFIAQSFQIGLVSKSKTSFNFIYKQMQKYENITKFYPELITMLNYGKMNKNINETYGMDDDEEEDYTPKLKI
jgi:hypothetical protein